MSGWTLLFLCGFASDGVGISTSEGLTCGPTVEEASEIHQGDDRLEFRSASWGRLYMDLQAAGVVNREMGFLPVPDDLVKQFSMTRNRFVSVRNKLHTTVGGALYDLILSTVARHVGMRMGEFNEARVVGEDLKPVGFFYDSHAAAVFYLTFAAGPEKEVPGSLGWWANDLYGTFPSFRFLVKKCLSNQRSGSDPEVCMAREMLASFRRLNPSMTGQNFQDGLLDHVRRRGRTAMIEKTRVQLILNEYFAEGGTNRSFDRIFEHVTVKTQWANDIVLAMPSFRVPKDELARFAPIIISRTETHDLVDPRQLSMASRSIGIALSLGEVEGLKLKQLLLKLESMLHPSQGQPNL